MITFSETMDYKDGHMLLKATDGRSTEQIIISIDTNKGLERRVIESTKNLLSQRFTHEYKKKKNIK